MNDKEFYKLKNEYLSYRRVYELCKIKFDGWVSDYLKRGVGDVNILYKKLQYLRELYSDYIDIESKYNFELNCRKEVNYEN